MLKVIFYAGAEYPEYLELDCEQFRVRDNYCLWLVGTNLGRVLTIKFESELIAVVRDEKVIEWLNPAWETAPYVNEKLLRRYARGAEQTHGQRKTPENNI